jgi:hypothetical protein
MHSLPRSQLTQLAQPLAISHSNARTHASGEAWRLNFIDLLRFSYISLTATAVDVFVGLSNPTAILGDYNSYMDFELAPPQVHEFSAEHMADPHYLKPTNNLKARGPPFPCFPRWNTFGTQSLSFCIWKFTVDRIRLCVLANVTPYTRTDVELCFFFFAPYPSTDSVIYPFVIY